MLVRTKMKVFDSYLSNISMASMSNESTFPSSVVSFIKFVPLVVKAVNWAYTTSDNDSVRSVRFRSILQLQSFRPDLIIVTHDFLRPAEVDLLKNSFNTKIALWFPDSVSCFEIVIYTANYDAMFFKDPYIVSILRSCLNRKLYYFPEYGPFCISSLTTVLSAIISMHNCCWKYASLEGCLFC